MQYNAENHYDDPMLKRLQVIYLEHYNFSRDRICEITHYVKATVRCYVSKFSYLLNKALQTFYHVVAPAVDSFREKTFLFMERNQRLHETIILFEHVRTKSR